MSSEPARLGARPRAVALLARARGWAARHTARIIALAKETGCDAIHPGYGFLAENAVFARAVADAGIAFIGPNAGALDLFGDKVAARELARRVGAPVGTAATVSVAPRS